MTFIIQSFFFIAQEDDSSPKTKSGRKVQKPVLFIPEAKKSQSDKRSKTSGKLFIPYISLFLYNLFVHYFAKF